MRVSKRILALALALLMVVGLMTTASANLNNVSDVADIAPEYRLAVGVLYNVGIIEGFADGTFRPETTVNRAQMAALIFRMFYGDDAVAPLRPTIFPDVTEGSGAWWARGVIAWAHGEGIVVGFPDGTFRPNQPVTIVEAATMLLRALGYGRMEEYQGEGWAQRASNDALARGIFNADIVDGFDVMDGAERQVAAQMIFNAMFARRVTFISALEIYQPIMDNQRGLFAWRYDLPLSFSVEEEVILAGFAIGGNVSFLNLDGTANPFTARYSPNSDEVGRVVNAYYGVGMRTGTQRIFFMDILSNDINVAAGATGAQRRAALGVTNANTPSTHPEGVPQSGRGFGVMTFLGYRWNNLRVSVSPVTGNLHGLSDVAAELLAAAPTTWVEFDGQLVTVLYTTRSVVDVTLYDDTVYIRSWLDAAGNIVSIPASAADIHDDLRIAGEAADIPLFDVNAAPQLRGQWANLEMVVQGGGVVYRLTPVATITGIVTFVDMGPGTDAAFRFAGSNTTLTYVHPAQNDWDAANLSDRLTSLENLNAPFRAFLSAPLPAPGDNTQLWTAYISGVTGHVISVERFVPDFTTAELVMVTGSGWNSETNVGFTTFVRADGTRVTNAPARPLNVAAAGAHAAMGAMRNNVAWAVQINGVWWLHGPLGHGPSGIGFDGLEEAGIPGTVFETRLRFAENGSINLESLSMIIFGNTFTLTNAQWILDNGTVGRFARGDSSAANIDNPIGYAYIVFIVDETTEDHVETVFIVRP